MKTIKSKTFSKKTLKVTAKDDAYPKHVAIIMDGNGRWAKKRGLTRELGHRAGSDRVKAIIDHSDKLGIQILTLYCFSTENWSRPQKEINTLMELLVHYLKKETPSLIENNVKMQSLGDITKLPKNVQTVINDSLETTKQSTGMIVNFCINYGGRQEITRAMREIAKDIEFGEIDAEQINEKLIASYLYTRTLPDPDLIIRSSGELRLSNFLLWQSAYSEFYISEKKWPDFKPTDLTTACEDFKNRKRRFGNTQDIVTDDPNSTEKDPSVI